MSRIPQIPEPVPFEFHGRTDYTTVYKAVDFPLDRFAIIKQNPVNRDRITEANKLIYALQKQINELRQTVIALAVEIDENVEKKVEINVEIGNEKKPVEATLLKDVYTFTLSGIEFGEATEVSVTAKVDEETWLVSSDVIECEEGGEVEIKATAQKEEGHIIIKKKEGESYKLTVKVGEGEPEDITETKTKTMTPASGDVIVFALDKPGYSLTIEPTSATADVEVTFTATIAEDETITEPATKTITVQ